MRNVGFEKIWRIWKSAQCFACNSVTFYASLSSYNYRLRTQPVTKYVDLIMRGIDEKSRMEEKHQGD